MGGKHFFIIGAGFTGLGAGLTSGFKIFEASDEPGGICASYQKEGFRFEIGADTGFLVEKNLSLTLSRKIYRRFIYRNSPARPV